MFIIKKITLKIEELSAVNVNLKCTEEGCDSTFTSSSNLAMHLAKHHNVESSTLNKKANIKILFHCPEKGCKYDTQGFFFTRAALLKQHYLKVHAPKDFICTKCKKGFATEASQAYHEQSCGVKFLCCCGAAYNSSEALRTHAKRKQHPVTKHMISKPTCNSKSSETSKPTLANGCRVLLAAVALSELSRPISRDFSTQTEILEIRPQKRKSTSPARAAGPSPAKTNIKRKASTQTQTSTAPKRLKMSTETQTTGDMILRKAMQNAHISTKAGNKRKKHSETQTLRKTQITKRKCIETQTPCNEINNTSDIANSFNYKQNSAINDDLEKSPELHKELKEANLAEIDSEITPKEKFTPSRTLIHDANLPDIWLHQKSTQTSPTENPTFFSPFENTLENLLNDDKFQSSETQTELAEYSENFLDDCDTNFTLCSNIETQTCSELHESLEEMLHSNMYTQTCDELLLDFADIQTQTWPDNFSPSSN